MHNAYFSCHVSTCKCTMLIFHFLLLLCEVAIYSSGMQSLFIPYVIGCGCVGVGVGVGVSVWVCGCLYGYAHIPLQIVRQIMFSKFTTHRK